MNKSKFWKFIKTYSLITIGLLIFTFGWTAFLIPSEITGGGISGIGALIFFSTGFPIGYTTLIINIVLILIAIRILGATFGIKTLYGILVTSVAFVLMQNFFTEPLTSDAFMATLIGAALGGTGVGIAFSNGGNAGGTDIIALIINKYRNISPGRVFLYIDIFVIASSYLIFESIEKIVYGYVVMAVASYTVDLVIEGSRQSFQIMIFSEQNEKIANMIRDQIGSGTTALSAKGWFEKKDNHVLLIIARKQEKPKILSIVDQCDKNAFISIAKVAGVFGKNFENLKL